ncbi:MAG: hypothetical protein ABIH23_29045, partial [bacterium]
REGWIFLSVSHSKKNHENPLLFLDGKSDPIILRANPDTNAAEAMQYLPEGKHQMEIQGGAGCRLVVRAVPELIYCSYPTTPHIAPHGDYSWAYLERYILSHVNTIIGAPAENEEFKQWIREGRKWLTHSSLPGLNQKEAPSVDEVYNVWSSNTGVTSPHYGGIVVDEFLMAGSDHYRAWAEGVRRLHADERFADKVFYAYCGPLFKTVNSPAMAFGRTLLEYGDRFALEVYLPEQPSEEKADRLLLNQLQHTQNISEECMPGWTQHLVMVLGYLSAPPESLNTNPGVDYKVFMDMQFHLLANDPTFWGMYGVMEYLANYADEEAVRWAHRLFRHYCIEGNRSRMSDDPYLLPHIQNPDFADGLHGWDVEPAATGAISTKNMREFSWLQGRYPQTSDGDRFLWMKRSASGPNRVRQTVKNLKPGKLYSLKFFSADLQNLHEKQELAVSVDLGDVEIRDDLSFQFVYPSCYSHESGPYTQQNPAYMNYHRVVFRPKHHTTELTISDWASPTEPGGPIGQESVCNFVEIQPFLEP